MLDADIQNTLRLIKLYRHLPEKNLEEVNQLISFENVTGYTLLPTNDNIEKFEELRERVLELSDNDVLNLLQQETGSHMKSLLFGIVEQMHVYLALRENVADENIHWLV